MENSPNSNAIILKIDFNSRMRTFGLKKGAEVGSMFVYFNYGILSNFSLLFLMWFSLLALLSSFACRPQI